MLLAVLSGLLLVPFVPVLHRTLGRGAGWVLGAVVGGTCAWFLARLHELAAASGVSTGADAFVFRASWFSSLGVDLSLRLDGLSGLFAAIVSGVGALILIYAGGYMKGDPRLPRLHATLLLFMTAMLGTVLAGDVLTLFVFWELTGITSFLLIGFDHRREGARDAALQALLVTGAGGLAMLVGFLLIARAAGTYDLGTILASGDALRAHPHYAAMTLLVLAGAFTKSAQVPFHFWLPGAMAAPTPVSAYLHSATMVKAGVYLVARMTPALGGTPFWMTVVAGFGAATFALGAWFSPQQRDLKRVLAFSTVSVLGALTFLLGIGAYVAAVATLIAHSLYKATLFLVAGTLDHETGTRDAGVLGGLARKMPVTFAAGLLAALSMLGVPPFFGFVSKEVLYEGILRGGLGLLIVLPLVMLAVGANAMLGASALIAGWRPFAGAPRETPKSPHEAPLEMLIGPVLLAVAGALAGGMAHSTGEAFVGPAVRAIAYAPADLAGGTPAHHAEVHLALWHGWKAAALFVLALSGITLAGAFAVFAWREELRRVHWRRLRQLEPLQPTRLFAATLAGVRRLATRVTSISQHGYLRRYIAETIAFAGALGLVASWRAGLLPALPADLVPRMHELAIVALMIAAAIVSVRTDSRLGAVCALGVVGYGMTLLFLYFGAPDLAMTQFAVETLTVVIYVFVLYRLPRFATFTSPRQRRRDAIFATCAGAGVALAVLTASAHRAASRISPEFAARSLTEARGHNVVNVILVDFRALDTMGEITVLAVAALGVRALMRLRSGRERR